MPLSPRALWLVLALAASAWARDPQGPDGFCAQYPTAPLCVGQKPACALCHAAIPERNAFGSAVSAQMLPGAPRPLALSDFSAALPAALRAVEALDSDGDNVSNLDEITAGTFPGDARSYPANAPCAGGTNPQYKVCHYDLRFAFRKVRLDFCGASPTYAELKAFDALSDDATKQGFIDSELDRCLLTDFWRGKNGALWRIANAKIRPVGSLKQGEDQGQIPLADYYDDYNLFAWAHTDDHDVREVLTANFYVARSGSNPTVYSQVQTKSTQRIDTIHRAGNMTSAWTLTFFVMFTALPRNAASQMYRAYLGLDIAKQEGLSGVPNEPRDYDAKGVQAQACAVCHATLDPLSYPYRNYNGISGPNSVWTTYVPNRIESGFTTPQAPLISQIPENGVILGQPVNTLVDWARVAANSDPFLISTVNDYWKTLIGHAPTAEENAAFTSLWQGLKSRNDYRVKPMLHELIRTEAYGAP